MYINVSKIGSCIINNEFVSFVLSFYSHGGLRMGKNCNRKLKLTQTKQIHNYFLKLDRLLEFRIGEIIFRKNKVIS